jgi:hypothetical protein
VATRKPVSQRWYYEDINEAIEPVLGKTDDVSAPHSSDSGEVPVLKSIKEQRIGSENADFLPEPELDAETERMLEDMARATDKYEAAIAMQPEAAYPNPVSASVQESVDYNLPEELGIVQEISRTILDAITDDENGACFLNGTLFEDGHQGWCRITGWGMECGVIIMFYSPISLDGTSQDEDVVSLAELISWLKQSPSPHVAPKFEASRMLQRSEQHRLNLCYRQQSYRPIQQRSLVGICVERRLGAKMGSNEKSIISDRTIQRILRAQETIFKYGTLIPRNDAEANKSPEAKRWLSGKQLEWLRLQSAETFERQWTWEKVRLAYPDYKKSDIGHMFFIYDYKFSGEHRVRLVFDGSRQSEATYNNTYAPTVRPESVRLFHIYAVEYSWIIMQYDVPQAFLRSKADCDIFVHPPNGFSEFAGQLLKLSKMLYGSKQAAHLWYNLLNDFLIEIGFTASFMDPCFYRRLTANGEVEALIILHVDDMRVAATDLVMKELHKLLYDKFDITTSDDGRFLGMDTEYDLETGVLRMHMKTYIGNTVDRFHDFDLSHGVPFREIVGSLLWIVLCIMGPELLRVKDLARRSNNFTADDYDDALKVLSRIEDRMEFGIIYRRDGAGKETIPRNTRLGGDFDCDILDKEDAMTMLLMSNNILAVYSTGDSTVLNELKESDMYKLDEHEDSTSEILKELAPTNARFTKVAYSDASFASTEMKQSITGTLVMINGTPILWGSLKQTVVVDSTCSAEYVAASVCSKQIMQMENMVQFLRFTCPKPYTMYTDSQACLQIANTASKLGKVRHIEIRYHLVRCLIIAGSIKLMYCITEDMIADLFTKVVSGTQDKRLAVRFYNDSNMLLFVENGDPQ